jgi:hypothetical protein
VTNLIIPPEGGAEETARILLELAETPAHVQTNTDAGMAFIVPDYLADAYEAKMTPASKDTAPKRGRARKDSD